MEKKRLVTILAVFLVVSFLIFVLVTQVLGVPLWWVFGSLVPLSIVQRPRLVVEVSPESPRNIGEIINVTVTNSSSKLPVEGAKVSAVKDGMEVTLYADSQGQTSFEFFGEVTVLTAEKTGINPSRPVAIPKAPAEWVRDTQGSLVIGIITGVAGSITTHILQRKKKQ